MVPHAIVRLLQPKSFLRFISLLTATEFITITLLINKVSGLYGILALFTGFQLSALQLSMYLYSIAVFALVCYLGPHIRKQTALHNLLLAWVYIFDTVINVTYTALFGLAWFITLAQHLDEDGGDQTLIPPGSELMNDTAGFTDPSAGKVDKVEVVAQPSPGTFPPGQDAKAYAFGDGNELGGALFDTGSLMSVTVICTLWLLRLYLVIIVMSYARSVLRQTMVSNAYTFQDRPRSKGSRPALSDTPTTAVESTSAADRFAQVGAKEGHGHTSRPRHLERLQNPFGASLPDGQGWGGRIGRLLSSFPRSYWLGNLSVVPELDDMQPEWARATEARFEHQRDHAARDSALPILKAPVPPTPVGTLERERRARRGTGPPPPGLDTTSPGQARSSEEIAPDEIRSAHG